MNLPLDVAPLPPTTTDVPTGAASTDGTGAGLFGIQGDGGVWLAVVVALVVVAAVAGLILLARRRRA